jgi:glycosyltransferase involved in cell wall biosynthesis
MVNVMPKAFSIVIPVVEQHDKFLPTLIAEISREAHLIEEIIICRSGLDGSKRNQYLNWLNQLSINRGKRIPICLESSRQSRKAGYNRNLGAQKAKSDWIAFVDADDSYSSIRFSILSKVIEKNPTANLILHSYTYEAELDEYPLIQKMQARSFEAVLNETLYKENYGGTHSEEDTNINVPFSTGGRSRVHHGHVTVRKIVFEKIQYLTEGTAEDGKFCKRVLREMGGVLYLPVPLSIYVVNESATNLSPLKRRIQKFAALFKSNS